MASLVPAAQAPSLAWCCLCSGSICPVTLHLTYNCSPGPGRLRFPDWLLSHLLAGLLFIFSSGHEAEMHVHLSLDWSEAPIWPLYSHYYAFVSCNLSTVSTWSPP